MKSLLSLKKGERAQIHSLLTNNEATLRKFMAFGILPGAVVEIIQISPVYVLRVDFTQVAVDSELAGKIMVGC